MLQTKNHLNKDTVQMKNNSRKILGRRETVLELPDLIEMQKNSYARFLQRAMPPDQRNPNEGLESVFRSTFPIESPNKDIVLECLGYSFGEEKYTQEESRIREMTYSVVLKATMRVIYLATGEIREKEVYVADIPLMTPRGTFIVNGAERVVVSQIHKSHGVLFSFDSKEGVFSSKIIPDRGTWLEFELDPNKQFLHVKIDRKKGVFITAFLRAVGLETTQEILSQFYSFQTIDLSKKSQRNIFEQSELEIRLAEDLYEPQTKELVFEAGQEINYQDLERLLSFGVEKIQIIHPEEIQRSRIILNCLDHDDVKTKAEAITKLHHIIRPGEPTTVEHAEKEFQKIFFDPKRYNLGVVGRYKLNQKLYEDEKQAPKDFFLHREDIILTLRYLLGLEADQAEPDDIDHLGNRRVRCVGELLVNQLKIGFSRMERSIREKMNTENIDEITPQKLISVKPINAVIREFFGSSQLSQFMDQTNPLAELTHKRRLNALGPGGLSRDRAGFEVRDVHHTHYGRICPVETPEGPNIGLILSLCNYAKVNEHGFLVTPYRRVKDGKVTDEIQYLTAIEEDRYYVAQADAVMDEKRNLIGDWVVGRREGEFPFVSPSKIGFMDISSQQVISVAASMIPFLEHDDANRALMGSNMQRQAVPLMNVDSPIVGTGMERKAAMDSGSCLVAKRSGSVILVSSEEIHVQVEDDEDNPVDIYSLIKYRLTNQNTCFNQRPFVKKGDSVNKGDLLADGPACDSGELALGRNVLVAFMSWEGANFEDAIVISERLVKEDFFTSIHIEEFQIEARETKQGTEKITPDIPNLSDKALSNLDENGIVRVGARVSSGDILVGKVTPKGDTESTPEYKLLHSIFGEKAREVKNTSLKVPHGNGGIVIGVNIFRRENGDELPAGVEEFVKVYMAKKRKLTEGDKMAGRHGNKGVISRVVSEADMPYLEDGTPVDIILNPLGVPSRMNLGQLLEAQLGWAGFVLKEKYASPAFEGVSLDIVKKKLKEADLPDDSKLILYDGKTGIPFENPITVGVIYMLKLAHMVDDKIHARSTGPYSLVTQQPLGGKAQFGGQRLGEMEVWALEAYGAAHTLQEFLTVKADDMTGRAKIYENIVKGKYTSAPGIPESFNVLVQELRGLGLDLNIYDSDGELLALTDKDRENINRIKNKE